MSENINSTLPEVQPHAVGSALSSAPGLPSEALARRRILLKGLGKGSAVLAAATMPMQRRRPGIDPS